MRVDSETKRLRGATRGGEGARGSCQGRTEGSAVYPAGNGPDRARGSGVAERRGGRSELSGGRVGVGAEGRRRDPGPAGRWRGAAERRRWELGGRASAEGARLARLGGNRRWVGGGGCAGVAERRTQQRGPAQSGRPQWLSAHFRERRGTAVAAC